MAWKNNNDSDEGKISDWNAAALKMKRLDNTLTTLNNINSNLRAFNMENGVYNYQLKFNQCDSLYLEVDSKLSTEEKELGKELRMKIKTMIEIFPVHKNVSNQFYNSSKQKINMITFRVLERLLFEYEILVRKFIDSHGMDTSYDDESSLF